MAIYGEHCYLLGVSLEKLLLDVDFTSFVRFTSKKCRRGKDGMIHGWNHQKKGIF